MSQKTTPPIIVDLGKVKKKAIKQLKQGEGKLVEELDAVLEQVRENFKGDANKELVPVVVLWRPKRKRRALLPLGF